jgi:hypothetical protein
MSARNNSRSSYVPRAPCCKVCKDAGEPESVYASHYVKDRDGNVTCPKLKAIVCLNCGRRGHTSSYCKAPAPAARAAPVEAAKKPEPLPAPVVKGRFACLFEDDSDDEKLLARKHTRPAPAKAPKLPAVVAAPTINVSNVFDFPSLSASASTDTKPAVAKASTKAPAFSYANMAAKPVESKPIRQVIAIPTRPVRPASPTTAPPRRLASEMNWAMTEDSDSDYDYRDYHYNHEDF